MKQGARGQGGCSMVQEDCRDAVVCKGTGEVHRCKRTGEVQQGGRGWEVQQGETKQVRCRGMQEGGRGVTVCNKTG